MTFFARILRLIWGGDVDRAIRPVVAVGFAGSVAFSAAYVYLSIWAIKHEHIAQSRLGLAYLVGAVLSLVAGYITGHLSDRLGRRPLILSGWFLEALVPIALIAVGHNRDAALLLIVILPVIGSLGGAADQAMIADLVAPDRQEAAYAMVRVAQNLGVTIGPVIGGFLLIGNDWTHLWIGAFVLGAIGAGIAYRYIPRGGAYAPEGPPERGSLAVIGRDRPFLLFLLFAALAQMTYMTSETLLPVSATTTHHLTPAYWGFLMILNPLLVTLFQLRVTRVASPLSAALKLGIAMPLMGVPYLLLNVNGSAPVIGFVIVVFVVGEMLWVPTSQAVVASLAPADIRGAYMGAFSGAGSVAFAITPFAGLLIRSVYGDATMWVCVASVGVLAGLIGALAARGHDARDPIPSPA
ncbi:MAG TPA: MFS transporter [Gaiellaceae bacterium]|nr:MFS transporter [Gaiellaceae bacterium]